MFGLKTWYFALPARSIYFYSWDPSKEKKKKKKSFKNATQFDNVFDQRHLEIVFAFLFFCVSPHSSRSVAKRGFLTFAAFTQRKLIIALFSYLKGNSPTFLGRNIFGQNRFQNTFGGKNKLSFLESCILDAFRRKV